MKISSLSAVKSFLSSIAAYCHYRTEDFNQFLQPGKQVNFELCPLNHLSPLLEEDFKLVFFTIKLKPVWLEIIELNLAYLT